MTKIVYSIYINIPKEDLDEEPPFSGEEISKSLKGKENFNKNISYLIGMQKEYASKIGAVYKFFGNDIFWEEYYRDMKSKYPFLTTYLILNFYKIHLLYELSEEYEEVLYLDLDVIPITDLDFFEYHDVKNNIVVQKEFPPHIKSWWHRIRMENSKTNLSARSPEAKCWNAHALLSYAGYRPLREVYNTGIVGASKSSLRKLNYFEDFEELLDLMTDLKEEEGMYSSTMRESFGWDNETILSYKIIINNVPEINLDRKWHYILDSKFNFIPEDTHMVHVINKEFDFARKRIEEINLHKLYK